MGLIDEELVAAVAATAAALSPRARKLARQGAVYGLAGAMKAGDVVASAARGAVRGVQSPSAADGAQAAPATTTPAPSRSPSGPTQLSGGDAQATSGTGPAGASARSTDGAADGST
jgi:hypothetical protein